METPWSKTMADSGTPFMIAGERVGTRYSDGSIIFNPGLRVEATLQQTPPAQPNKHWDTYPRVSWRGVLPMWSATQEIAFFLNVENVGTVRYRIDKAHAEKLISALQWAIENQREVTRVQSDKSSGNPILEGSPTEGQNV